MIARRKGRAWVFPGEVTTDDILPGRYLDLGAHEVARHAMAGLDPQFASRIAAGDIVVGGAMFGRGSGRESAASALLHVGVGAIVAPSFGHLFFRNCINLGLPALAVDRIDGIDAGDDLAVDLETRAVTDERTGVIYPIRNLRGISLDILRAGGIVAHTRLRQTRLAQGEGS